MKIVYENCRLKNYMKETVVIFCHTILHPAVLIYDFHIFITSIYQLIIFFAYYCSFVKTSLFVCFFFQKYSKEIETFVFLSIGFGNLSK